jgi:hypothetical protein
MNINWEGVLEKTIAGLLVALIIGVFGYFTSNRFKLIINKYLFCWVRKTWRSLLSLLLIFCFEFFLYIYSNSLELIVISIIFIVVIFIAFSTFLIKFYPHDIFLFDYNLSIAHQIIHSQGPWQPNIAQRGIALIDHANLTRYLTLPDFTSFSNGIIECEVYLNPGALINIMLRGSLALAIHFIWQD